MQPRADITDLRFGDIYTLPVGPKGLEPSEKLLGLAGKRVRLRGYMVRQSVPTPEAFILSPIPVETPDEDEGLADDLPPSVIFVHVSPADAAASGDAFPYARGVLQVTGVLELGPRDEADGRVSHVRVRLASTESSAVMKLGVTPTEGPAELPLPTHSTH